MHYTEQIYRPPSEARSVLLEVTTGCSHNLCTFCNAAKGLKFRPSPMEHIIEDVKGIAAFQPDKKRIHLLSHDAFALSYERLMERCKKNYAYHSEISANILSMILSKTAYLADRVEVISHRNTREKLMCYFRMLAGGGDVAFLPINFSQLADYICADRSAMMRELKNMKEDGLIATEKRKIFITENR